MTDYQIPTKIKKTPDGIEITWQENHLSFFDSRKLRGECPCALCVNEHTGKRIIDVSDESPFPVDPLIPHICNSLLECMAR